MNRLGTNPVDLSLTPQFVKRYLSRHSFHVPSAGLTQRQADQYVMISTWENEDALVSFAGEEWSKPVIPDGIEKFVKRGTVTPFVAIVTDSAYQSSL